MKYRGVVSSVPEMQYTPTGRPVTNFIVYTDDERLCVIAWNELAEKISQHVQLEDRVEVFGSKKTRWWTDSSGEKHSREELNIHRLRRVARVLHPVYCCLACNHYEADCLSGCYNAFGSAADRETCLVENLQCGTLNSGGALMNRDCWEKK